MDSAATVDQLFRKASNLQRAGNIEQAIAGFVELLRRYPDHMRGLNRLGNCLLSIGKIRESSALFERAASLYPDSAVSHFNLGRSLAMLGENSPAHKALVAAVKLKPDLAMAWLHLGSVLHEAGDEEKALACYQRAFDLSADLEKMPQMQGIPPEMSSLIRDALRALRQKYLNLHNSTFSQLASQLGEENLRRVEACLAIQHGKTKALKSHPKQQPESIYFPDLTPLAWFERDQFSWIKQIENQWQLIRNEYMSLGNDQAAFTPYVGDGPGVPESMQNLAGSHDWDSYHLYVGGELNTANAACCPATVSLLETVPLARLAGVAPEAFFSILRPGAHIKPHHGISNVKVAVHLPLIVPENCAIRVGDDWRSWQEGQCLVFDDSFEHEAYNRSDQIRVVLIFEVWHPDVSETEALAMTELSSCIDKWSARETGNLLESL